MFIIRIKNFEILSILNSRSFSELKKSGFEECWKKSDTLVFVSVIYILTTSNLLQVWILWNFGQLSRTH